MLNKPKHPVVPATKSLPTPNSEKGPANVHSGPSRTVTHSAAPHVNAASPSVKAAAQGSAATQFKPAQAYPGTQYPHGYTTTHKPATGGTTSLPAVGSPGGVVTTKAASYVPKPPDPRLAVDFRPHFKKVSKAFDHQALRRICTMGETEFAAVYGMTQVDLPADKTHKAGFYAFKDNGAKILAVAHLDTVSPPEQRMCNFVNTSAGPAVFSRSLDDRLGAYIILDLLPTLGLTFDWLLTTNEEIGDSTAFDFKPPVLDGASKEYNWVIEFDRGGTDVVMYQYEDTATSALLRESGLVVGHGSCSDISYLEELNRKAFNWGTGYRDYHGPKAHAYLLDTFKMVGHFLDFHEANGEKVLEHAPKKYGRYANLAASDRYGYGDADPYAGDGWWNEVNNYGI